jgi:hypothetical protein
MEQPVGCIIMADRFSTGRQMSKNNAIAREDLENMIETEILEILGDPDAGLDLREEFKAKIRERQRRMSPTVPHSALLDEG